MCCPSEVKVGIPACPWIRAPPASGCEGFWAAWGSPVYLLYAVAGMRGLDRSGNEGSLPVCCRGRVTACWWLLCHFLVLVPTSRLVTDRGGRQRGRGGKRWRVGWRLCFCLETSTSPHHLAPCVPPSFHVSLPLPTIRSMEAGKQDSAGNQGPLSPSCSASDPLCDPEPGPPPLWVSTISKHFSLRGQDWVRL